jgi:PAS domain S-box-containing protein
MKDESKPKEQLIRELDELRQYVSILKNSEEELKRLKVNREKIAGAFMQNSIPMSINTLEEGRFIYVSEGFLKLMGFELDEVIGKTPPEIGFTTGEQSPIFFNELNKNGRVDNFEVQVRTKGGELKYGLFNAVTMTLNDEKYLLTIMTDITDRKLTEEKLIEAKENLERLVQERTVELMIKNRQLEADVELRKGYEERLKNKRQNLELKSSQLEQLNSALQVLLKQREDDKRELEDKVVLNIKKLVLPHVENLKKSKLERKSLIDLNIIESNLNNIISPFTQKLSAKFLGFTHKEIQVANMVKEGKDTKEIANFMNVSISAVKLHRYHIRNKLGLVDQKVNLRSYLSSLP